MSPVAILVSNANTTAPDESGARVTLGSYAAFFTVPFFAELLVARGFSSVVFAFAFSEFCFLCANICSASLRRSA